MTIAYDIPKVSRPPRTSKAVRVGVVVYLSQAHASAALHITRSQLRAMLADGRAVVVADAPDGKAGEVARILLAAAHIREDASVAWDGDDVRRDIRTRRRNLLKAMYLFRNRHGHGVLDGPEGAL